MNRWILALGKYEKQSLESLQVQAEFRRATHNMLLSFCAVKKCLDSLPIPFNDIVGNTGLVIGTSHGELNTTIDFLKELSVNEVARPLLFQNSLHNATLGFLCKAFSITGPAFTVSEHTHTAEAALNLADDLLNTELKYCLVVGVDALLPQLEKPFKAMYPLNWKLGEGAAAVLLSKDREPIKPIGLLKRVDLLHSKSEGEIRSGYDSDAIEQMVTNFSLKTSIEISKPMGSNSLLEWERVS